MANLVLLLFVALLECIVFREARAAANNVWVSSSSRKGNSKSSSKSSGSKSQAKSTAKGSRKGGTPPPPPGPPKKGGSGSQQSPNSANAGQKKASESIDSLYDKVKPMLGPKEEDCPRGKTLKSGTYCYSHQTYDLAKIEQSQFSKCCKLCPESFEEGLSFLQISDTARKNALDMFQKMHDAMKKDDTGKRPLYVNRLGTKPEEVEAMLPCCAICPTQFVKPDGFQDIPSVSFLEAARRLSTRKAAKLDNRMRKSGGGGSSKRGGGGGSSSSSKAGSSSGGSSASKGGGSAKGGGSSSGGSKGGSGGSGKGGSGGSGKGGSSSADSKASQKDSSAQAKSSEKAGKQEAKASAKSSKEEKKSSDKAAKSAKKSSDKAAKSAKKSSDKAAKSAKKSSDKAAKSAKKSSDKAAKSAKKESDRRSKSSKKESKAKKKASKKEGKANSKSDKKKSKASKKAAKAKSKASQKAAKSTGGEFNKIIEDPIKHEKYPIPDRTLEPPIPTRHFEIRSTYDPDTCCYVCDRKQLMNDDPGCCPVCPSLYRTITGGHEVFGGPFGPGVDPNAAHVSDELRPFAERAGEAQGVDPATSTRDVIIAKMGEKLLNEAKIDQANFHNKMIDKHEIKEAERLKRIEAERRKAHALKIKLINNVDSLEDV